MADTTVKENIVETAETENSVENEETEMETDAAMAGTDAAMAEGEGTVETIDTASDNTTVAKPEKKGGGGLIWTLQPHSYESLCALERLYRQGVLKKALENDVRNSGCYDGLDLDDLVVEVSFKDEDLRACKEELALGNSFLSGLTDNWNAVDAPSASREQCGDCVRRLAQYQLLITSPYVAKYLRAHKPLFLKLGQIALTQYITRGRDLEAIAHSLGYSLLHEDILNSGFVTIDPSAPNQSVFSAEDLKAWFAAYYVVKGNSIAKLDELPYPTVDNYIGDVCFHQCLINLDSAFSLRLASRLNMTHLEATDVLKMVTWLQKLEGEFPLHETTGSRGFYIGQLMALFPQCKRWTLSNLELKQQDMEAIVQGFHNKKGSENPVETIVMSHNQLAGGGAAVGRLMMALALCKHWDLSHTGLTPEDFSELAATVGDKKLEQLCELVLDQTEDTSGVDLRIQPLVDLMPQCQVSYRGGAG